MAKEFGCVIMLILTIIFICNPLHSFSAAWLEQFRHIEDFPHYFLFLPLPLAYSHSASPKYVCHMWGVFRPPHPKVCTWVCMCTLICSQAYFGWERGGVGENTYVCIWQRSPSRSQSHCPLFLAELSTDPVWVLQMSVRDRSPHLSLTLPLHYNHPADGR